MNASAVHWMRGFPGGLRGGRGAAAGGWDVKKIGILFGVENSFPSALVEQINARNVDGIRAEFVLTGAVQHDKRSRYAVIVDRISHAVPFYRAFLKHAMAHGTVVINNPFRVSADDKFFNYTLAEKLGVAVPPTCGKSTLKLDHPLGEAIIVRRQNSWPNLRRRLAECWPRLVVDVRRRAFGAASADVRWSAV